jgi:acyl-CoA thioesterase I
MTMTSAAAGAPGGAATKVVILGASYAKGWRPSDPAIAFINKGMEGQQSWELLERFERDVLRESPRAVIIWGFINDIFRSPAAEVDAALERARQSFTAMVERAEASSITPIVATEVPIRGRKGLKESTLATIGSLLGKRSYQDRVNAQVRAMNAWIRTMAAEHRLTILDLHHVLADGRGRRRPEYATSDGSHLSPGAYHALTETFVPDIRAAVAVSL